MKLLVTGHKGFIGQHLVRYLKTKTQHEIVTYDWLDEPNKLDFDYESLDWIIHLGAISKTSETDTQKIINQNVNHTIALFENAVKHNVHFQFSSSASVYGQQDESINAFNETLRLSPLTPYSWSKYFIELYINGIACPDNIHVQSFRYFNVYGPEFEDHKEGQASPYYMFSKDKETKGYIELYLGSENFRRDFVSVEQIVETQMKFLSVPESGIWNIGTGKTKSFYEIALEFDSVISWNVMSQKMMHNYQKYTCADITKLNSTLAKYGLI